MRLPLAILTFSAATLLAQTSEAREWVERSLTLKPFAFAGEIGFGMGRNVDEPDPSVGASFEAKLGLPLGLEAGFRIGERFSDQATGANADAYGRIHDPFSLEVDTGSSRTANPEFMLQLSLLSSPRLDLAGRLRFVAGLSPNSPTFLSPGVPIRFRLHRLLRVDAAVEVPIRVDRSATWGLELPVAAWFQLGSAFVGPLSGLFVNVPPYSLGTEHQGSILLGVGGGYTFSGVVDVKAQVLTPNVAADNWAKVIGGGVGIGVAIP